MEQPRRHSFEEGRCCEHMAQQQVRELVQGSIVNCPWYGQRLGKDLFKKEKSRKQKNLC